jgi:16S rRNA (uracil1498-N3)-methyltransferase
MRLTRVYSAAPLASGLVLALEGNAADHVARVMRLRPGAAISVFDGRGGEYAAELLAVDRRAVRIAVGAHRPLERESPLELSLVQGISRGERMDLVVQKATELGVTRIVPYEAERSVVRLDAPGRARRLAHWQAVAAGACEQCGRNRLPRIDEPCGLEAALASVAGAELRMLLDPLAAAAASSLLFARPPSVAILIGPEGGLAHGERALALQAGFVAGRLGPRVLRTETAAITALATVQAIAGDLSQR